MAQDSEGAKNRLVIAVAQMTSIDKCSQNLLAISKHLEQVRAHGEVDLVSFPENSLYMRLEREKPIEFLDLDSAVFGELSQWARSNSCALHLGAVPLTIKGQHFNSTVLVLPDGRIEAPYQKIHLFDVDIEGQQAIRESDSFEHGSSPYIWDYRGWKFGLTICYDLRFSELYQIYSRARVDGILIPSAFTVPTGRAHWEILLRARAIESQCFVIAAAQDGVHANESSHSKATYGHSMIIDPWGTILAEAEEGPQLLFATLEKSRLVHVRRQIPMAQHRRL